VIGDESPRGVDDILRLHPIKTARLDDLLDVFLIRCRKRGGVRIAGEERRGGEIYARVRALRRENHRDQ